MNFYLKRAINSSDSLLFLVYEGNASEEIVYRLKGTYGVLSGKISLLDERENEMARMVQMGTPSLSKFSIEIPGRRKAMLIRNLTVPGGSFVMRCPSWRLRGTPVSGNFDLVDVDRRVVLTHGVDWKQDVYAIQIQREEDVILGLCVCAAVDSVILGENRAPVVQRP